MEVSTNWREIVEKYNKGQILKFEQFIDKEIKTFDGVLNVFPKKEKIFRCFNYFNIEETKVVLIGQDPYHGPDQATGLCFDIDETSGCKYPPSLKNIEKGIASLSLNYGQGNNMNQSSNYGDFDNFGIGSFYPPYGGMYG